MSMWFCQIKRPFTEIQARYSHNSQKNVDLFSFFFIYSSYTILFIVICFNNVWPFCFNHCLNLILVSRGKKYISKQKSVLCFVLFLQRVVRNHFYCVGANLPHTVTLGRVVIRTGKPLPLSEGSLFFFFQWSQVFQKLYDKQPDSVLCL